MIFKAPQNTALRDHTKKYVFLAGSIENGKAENWQIEMTDFFTKLGFGIFNPRRDGWDSTLPNTFENPVFFQQVNWELDELDEADMILLYLDPDTISGISLLELGLYSKSKKIIVVCPEGFWRKGNVDIVCYRNNIPLFTNLSDFKHYFRKII